MSSELTGFQKDIVKRVEKDYARKLGTNPCKFVQEYKKLERFPGLADNVHYISTLRRVNCTLNEKKLNKKCINKIVEPFVSKNKKLLTSVLDSAEKGAEGFRILEFLLSDDFPFDIDVP